MSIARGKDIVIKYNLFNKNFQPKIRWVAKRKEFIFLVPSMYEVVYLHETEDISMEEVYISEVDLWRMINADRGISEDYYFSYKEEQGELSDDTYLGVSFVQQGWYVSKNTLVQAKRASKKLHHSAWIILKRRVPKGGRPVGGGIRKEMSPEEKERCEYLIANYERIVANCIRKDWVTEYIELERDIAKYKGLKKPSKKSLIAHFTELRNNYNNK